MGDRIPKCGDPGSKCGDRGLETEDCMPLLRDRIFVHNGVP